MWSGHGPAGRAGWFLISQRSRPHRRRRGARAGPPDLCRPLQRPSSAPGAGAATAGSAGWPARRPRAPARYGAPARPTRRAAPRVPPTSCMNVFPHPTGSGLLEDPERLVPAGLVGAHAAEVVEHLGLPPPVAGPACRFQGELAGGTPIVPVAASVQEAGQAVGELPGHGPQFLLACLLDRGEEVGALGGEPTPPAARGLPLRRSGRQQTTCPP